MTRINLACAGPAVRLTPVPLAKADLRPVDDFEAYVLVTGRDLLSDHIERVFGGDGRTAAEIRALLARYVDERIAARRVA